MMTTNSTRTAPMMPTPIMVMFDDVDVFLASTI